MAQQKHTVEVIKPDVELDESLTLHERGWKVQRAGWVFIFGMMALAALGLFGEGPVSKRTADVNGSRVEYDRFFRHEARMELKVDLQSSGTEGAVVSFPNAYLKNFRVESILPEPKSNTVAQDQVSYQFDGTPPMHLVFYLVPQQMGTIKGSIRVNNNTIPLNHFIYP